jgi:hypothetical protein
VYDLKIHCIKSHSGEVKQLEEDAFSESNGFYLSLNPKDYVKHIAKSDRLSNTAVKFRTLMLMWEKQVKGIKSRSRQEILDGWDAGEQSFNMPDEITIIPESTSEDIKILHISLNLNGSPHIDMLNVYDRLRVLLTSDVYDDKMAMRALARRMAELKSVKGHDNFDVSNAQLCNELKEKVCGKLNVHRSLISNIYVMKTEMLSSPKRIKLASDVCSEPSLPEGTSTNKANTCTQSTSTSSAVSLAGSNPSVRATTSTSSIVSHITTLMDSNIPEIQSSPTAKVLSAIPKAPLPPPVLATAKSCGVLSSADTISATIPKATSQTSLSYRANKLLRMGAMPVFPPARREWSADEVITIIEDDVKFKWPPKDWKYLSPDNKLLQFEFSVFAILKQRGVTPKSRSYTHDLFNFLVLPGTASHVEKGDTSHNSRFFVYERLRQIATDKESLVDKVETDKWLAMIECGSMLRDTVNDKLLKICDKVPVPLRI